jgi:hypothetical protein
MIWILAALALFGIGFSSPVMADVPCFPTGGSRIAICSSSCSGAYCGYNLPFAGKRAFGTFVSYYTTSDAKPLSIPDGQNQVQQYMRLTIPTAGASLHMSIDEGPDFCCWVQVRREGGAYFKEFKDNANENFTLDDLDPGNYIIGVIHDRSVQGGPTATYVPTVYLVPTVKSDLAGGTPQTARDLGAISKDKPFDVDAYLQRITERTLEGNPTSTSVMNNDADCYRIIAPGPGFLKVDFQRTSVLDSDGVQANVGSETEFSQAPIALPKEGLLVKGGPQYLVVWASPQTSDGEYGLKYHLHVVFVPSP